MKWSIFFVNIIVHVGVMALFLTIFFFTIAQYFEKKIIEDQIDFVIDDFVGNTLKPISTDKKNQIKTDINKAFAKQDFSSADQNVIKENKKISTKAWIFVSILFGTILIIALIFGFIFKWEKYYIKFLFNSTLLSLLFIAITETLFMYLIAQNFLSADPNKIKSSIIKTLGQNRCVPCNKNNKNCIGSTICK